MENLNILLMATDNGQFTGTLQSSFYRFYPGLLFITRNIKCLNFCNAVYHLELEPQLKRVPKSIYLLFVKEDVASYNKIIIPVAEFIISTTQKATSITNWLTAYRQFYEEQCGKEFKGYVVSDFSGAILKAYVQALNGNRSFRIFE